VESFRAVGAYRIDLGSFTQSAWLRSGEPFAIDPSRAVDGALGPGFYVLFVSVRLDQRLYHACAVRDRQRGANLRRYALSSSTRARKAAVSGA
jgi:hypothetical protein